MARYTIMINFSFIPRILANDFEKKWDLHKGIYSLHASREAGLVFKGSRTEATISRQVSTPTKDRNLSL